MTSLLTPATFILNDVEEAMEVGTRVFYPHRVEPVTPRRGFAMELVAGRIGSMTVGELHYANEVVVDEMHIDDSYAVGFTLGGRVEVRTPLSEVYSSPATAAILRPGTPVRLHGWDTDTRPLLVIKFDRRVLEAEVGRMLGRDPAGSVEFAATLDLTTGPGLRWRRIVRTLTADLMDSRQFLWNPLIYEHLTSTIITGLLLSAEHQHREAFEARITPATPHTIRRATAFIDEHLHEPISTGMVASAVGLSVRALERGFARHLSTSPRRYLEQARLAMAHSELMIQTPSSASVSQIASKYGFGHHGRFANLYHSTFGRSPSETLRDG